MSKPKEEAESATPSIDKIARVLDVCITPSLTQTGKNTSPDHPNPALGQTFYLIGIAMIVSEAYKTII